MPQIGWANSLKIRNKLLGLCAFFLLLFTLFVHAMFESFIGATSTYDLRKHSKA